MLAKRRKKGRGSAERLARTSLKKHERSFKEQGDACAIISTKMLAHASHFRDVSV